MKRFLIISLTACLALSLCLTGCMDKDEAQYKKAEKLFNDSEFSEAIPLYSELSEIGYEDSLEKYSICKRNAYLQALAENPKGSASFKGEEADDWNSAISNIRVEENGDLKLIITFAKSYHDSSADTWSRYDEDTEHDYLLSILTATEYYSYTYENTRVITLVIHPDGTSSVSCLDTELAHEDVFTLKDGSNTAQIIDSNKIKTTDEWSCDLDATTTSTFAYNDSLSGLKHECHRTINEKEVDYSNHHDIELGKTLTTLLSELESKYLTDGTIEDLTLKDFYFVNFD